MAAALTFETPSFELATPQDPEGPAGDSEGSDDGSGNGSSKKRKAAPGKGRRKIPIEFIADKNKRAITFSKRKAGIFTKARELSTLTGSSLLLLVVSSSGIVYTFTTEKFQPLVTQPEGKSLIAACLNGTVKTGESEEPLEGTKRGGTIVLRDAFKDHSNTASTSALTSSFPPLPKPSTSTSASSLPPLPPSSSEYAASSFVPSYRPDQLEKRTFDTLQGEDVYDQSLLNVPDEEEEQARSLSRLRRSLSLERRFEENTQHEMPATSLSMRNNDKSFSQDGEAAPAIHPPIGSFTNVMDGWSDWHSRFNPASSTSRDTSNARGSATHPGTGEGSHPYSSHTDYVHDVHQAEHQAHDAPLIYTSSASGGTIGLSASPGLGAFDPDPDMIALQHQASSTRPNTRSRSQQVPQQTQSQRALSTSSGNSAPFLSPNTGDQYAQYFAPDTHLQQQDAGPQMQSSQPRPTLYPNSTKSNNADIPANITPSKHAQAGEDGLLSLFDRMDYNSEAFKKMLETIHQIPEYKEMHDRAMKKWEEGEGAKIREELMAAAKAAAGNSGEQSQSHQSQQSQAL